MSNNTRLYGVLGVTKNASENDIKSAFKKLSKQYQNDPKSKAKLQEISFAYEVLSDPEKKKIYDTYGEEAVHQSNGDDDNDFGGFEDGGGVGGFSDIFDMLRGGGRGGSSRKRQGPVKGEPVKQPLPVTLEELYLGTERKIKVTRTRNCSSCKGTGSTKPEMVQSCKTCGGNGVVIQQRSIGPGFVQQFQSYCPDCSGTGKSVDDKYKCNKCGGKKVVEESKVLSVTIERGSEEGQKIVFENEGDESPGVLASDIYFYIQQKPNKDFQRDGTTLLVKKKITLAEALTGLTFNFEHLDKRILVISTKPGMIIKPFGTLAVENEGFPAYKKPGEKGTLIFYFEVEFPTVVPRNVMENLQKILPVQKPIEQTEEHVTVELEEAVFNTKEQQKQREADRKSVV